MEDPKLLPASENNQRSISETEKMDSQQAVDVLAAVAKTTQRMNDTEKGDVLEKVEEAKKQEAGKEAKDIYTHKAQILVGAVAKKTDLTILVRKEEDRLNECKENTQIPPEAIKKIDSTLNALKTLKDPKNLIHNMASVLDIYTEKIDDEFQDKTFLAKLFAIFICLKDWITVITTRTPVIIDQENERKKSKSFVRELDAEKE